MNRIIILYGLLSGLIVSATLLVTVHVMRTQASEVLMYAVGFGSMLLAFALMFVAVRQYRNTLPEKRIRFGKAFTIAALIALIDSICYATTWTIIYKFFYPEFLDDYFQHKSAGMQKAGKSAAEILKLQTEKADMKIWYDHWWGVFGSAIFEILPIGILIALICAFIYSRRRKSPLRA